MSEAYQCDHCGLVRSQDEVFSWHTVDTVGRLVLQDETGPWHFDTWRCLVEWAAAKAGQK